MQTVINLLVLNRRTCKQEQKHDAKNYLTVTLKLNSHASCWPIIGLPAG